MELIDRDALCREISNGLLHNNKHNTIEEFQTIWKCINETPIVEINSVTTAHWIKKPLSKHPDTMGFWCSGCEQRALGMYNFCPYCGAKMVEIVELNEVEK